MRIRRRSRRRRAWSRTRARARAWASRARSVSPQAFHQPRDVARKLRFERNRLSGERMAQGELPRVQRLAIQQRFGSTGIDRIAFDGMADRCEVDADLVRASGLEVAFEERMRAQPLAHAVARDRVLAARD